MSTSQPTRPQATLRALILEDCARCLGRRRGHAAAARLLRRPGLDDLDLEAVCVDLSQGPPQVLALSVALGLLRVGDERGAASCLADRWGLSLDAWIAGACEEQGVEVSARSASLRGLVTEDIARIAERAHRPAAAMLLRRHPDDEGALRAVANELSTSGKRPWTEGADAVALLARGQVDDAVALLADLCGLEPDEWIARACEEQGVELAAEVSP